MYKFLLLILSLFCLTSCIELLDDVTLNSDGSGKFKYLINLSSSKTKANSILALDSIDGRRVFKKPELEQKIKDFKKYMSEEPGISNVTVEYNFEDYIFKFNCDFENVKNLQSAIKNSIKKLSVTEYQSDLNWMVWQNSKLDRNIPDFATDRFKNSNWLDIQLLQSGTYTSISRFDKPVDTYTNTLSKVSKSKKALMIQVKTSELLNNTQILKNNISLEGNK